MNESIQSQLGGITRRSFLSRASLGATGALLLPNAMGSVTLNSSRGAAEDVLITVFLRGAQDGLSLVVPHGDPMYSTMRLTSFSDMRVTPTDFFDQSTGQFFGVNPMAADLMTPWNDGKLAILNQVGLKDNGTRSHFDAMARMETGTDDAIPLLDGWSARILKENTAAQSGLRGISLTALLPRMLSGAPSTLPIANPANFSFPAPPQTLALRKLKLDEAYAATGHEIVGKSGVTTLGAIDDVALADTGNYTSSGLTPYPTSPFGEALRSIAALLNSSTVSLETAHVDVGGWDHHSQLGPVSGTFAAMVGDLAEGLRAFYEDMAAASTPIKYTLVVQTEFGRRIRPNASEGLDHGKGGLMMVMGPAVQGGGEIIDAGWKNAVMANPADSPLDPNNSDDGDLPVEIDYREVLGEICMDRLGLSLSQVENQIFPGFTMPGVDWGVTLP